MLTAKAEEIDRIVGLEFGADDYVTKPFSPREVVLRIRAIMRRADAKELEEHLAVGPIRIDAARHEVSVNGKRVNLTSLEVKLLQTLMQRRGRVQARDRLLKDVWGYESVIDTRTVDTHVRRLRKKLGKAADVIESVRGFAGFSSEIALWTVKQAASSRRRECVFAGQLGGIENLSNLASS